MEYDPLNSMRVNIISTDLSGQITRPLAKPVTSLAHNTKRLETKMRGGSRDQG